MSTEFENNGSQTICMLHIISASFLEPKHALWLLLSSVTCIVLQQQNRVRWFQCVLCLNYSCKLWYHRLHSRSLKSQLTNSINERQMHSTTRRLETCETNKTWDLLPPSLKLTLKFLLSGVVQDSTERGSLGLKDDGLWEVIMEREVGKKMQKAQNVVCFAITE